MRYNFKKRKIASTFILRPTRLSNSVLYSNGVSATFSNLEHTVWTGKRYSHNHPVTACANPRATTGFYYFFQTRKYLIISSRCWFEFANFSYTTCAWKVLRLPRFRRNFADICVDTSCADCSRPRRWRDSSTACGVVHMTDKCPITQDTWPIKTS